MNLGEVLTLGPTCEVCHRRARWLYPLTHYDGKHFRPVRACATCCGPTGDDDIARTVRFDQLVKLRKPVAR